VHPITLKAILGVLVLRGGRGNGKEGERDKGKREKEKAREGMGEKGEMVENTPLLQFTFLATPLDWLL